MWSNIVKTIERGVILNLPKFIYKNSVVTFAPNGKHQRLLTCSAVKYGTGTEVTRKVLVEEEEDDDDDDMRIIPYEDELKKVPNFKSIIEALRTKFILNKTEIGIFMNEKVIVKKSREQCLIANMKTLCLAGVNRESFIANPWIVALNGKTLMPKIGLLKSVNGIRDINDFVPFLRLQLPRLRKLVCALNIECYNFNNGNRFYYISEKLNLSPGIVSKYLAKRLFILEKPFEMINTNLQNMIIYNVEPISILKDLWGFRYGTSAVEERLRRAVQAKKEKIMPWMVRCPDRIYENSLQLTLNELKVLDGKTSVAEYVGERLGFSPEQSQAIMNKHPLANKVSATKLKEVLDYLLNEAKFTRFEIAQAPRIFCHSLETTKQRIEELERYGCRPATLSIVCRSKREYEKFVRGWLAKYNKVPQGEKN